MWSSRRSWKCIATCSSYCAHNTISSQNEQSSVIQLFRGLSALGDCRVDMKLTLTFSIMMLVRDFTVVNSLMRKTFVRNKLCKTSYSSYSRLQARLPANDASMDTNLLATNPDLVISHLTSRRSNPALLEDVSKIAALRTERNQLIVKGDAAKGVRKTLSQQIGQLMKEGKSAEVAALKLQVEEASVKAAECDTELVTIDAAINRLFSVLPNLLDDRLELIYF
jgi:Seryl-tRNA synthetase N-terminal domain